MSCRFCKDASLTIRAKLGRCKRCMIQLAVMNLVLWPIWFIGFSDTPTSIESITLLFGAGASAILLTLHLILMPFRMNAPEPKK
ncbi:DUF3624 domain-containing protein [Grimontia sp. SpTr1]|uniref:DUF3624 domain-containing protein n=1 Tax=Grimontia sp. SpTr1 TaxID=2995319 RepID=UPI00248CE367|nr:DUF3624 domain-containing protein [Grimontia sp. SpTr1]